MILVRSSITKKRISKKKLIKQATAVLSSLGYKGFDLGIWLTTNKTIQRYNKTYRGKDKPTDILSFPMYPKLKPHERINAQKPDEKNLGDLIISVQYIVKDAPFWNQTFDERLKVLLVHGICHLLGHDHETEEEYEIMHKEEKRLLELI